MEPNLENDRKGTPVQGILAPKVAQSFAVGGASARNATNFGQKIVRVYSSEDCFIAFGDNTVTASNSDHFLPANTLDYFLLNGSTRIAAIQDTTSGTLYISEMG